MKAEGVEEGEQKQEADDAKNDHDQDGVPLQVRLVPRDQCGGGQGARGRQRSIDTGWRRLHGGHLVASRHDGSPRWLWYTLCSLKGETKVEFGKPHSQIQIHLVQISS